MSDVTTKDFNEDFNKLLESYNLKITEATVKQNTMSNVQMKDIITKYKDMQFFQYIDKEKNVELFILVLSILSIDYNCTLFNKLNSNNDFGAEADYTSHTRPIDKIYKNSIHRYVNIRTSINPIAENILEYLDYVVNNILTKLKINHNSREEYDNKHKIDKLIIVKYKNSKLYMKNLVKHFNHSLKPI